MYQNQQSIQTVLNQLRQTSPTPDPSSPNAAPKQLCPVCNGLGYVRGELIQTARGLESRLFRCSCQAVPDASRLQARIGSPILPLLFTDICTAGRSGTLQMVACAVGWIRHPDCILTIWGRNGTGKSMVLQAITGEVIRRGVAALYVRAHDLLDFLKAGIGDDDYDVAARLNVLASVPVLCIDELTLVRWTDWVAEQLESLLDLRYSAERGTVLAMDTDPAATLHARLLSRMREGVMVENHDSDFRQLLAEAKKEE